MDFLKNIADSVTKAVDFVVDKNRKAAMINRLKIVIKNEREKQLRAYAELGKYYYKNMRDAQNEETEKDCTVIENSSRRLSRAVARLDEITADENCTCDEDGENCSCDENCTCGGDSADNESCNDDEKQCCGEYNAEGTEKKCGGFDDSEDYGQTAPENKPDESYEGFPHICEEQEDKGSGEAADDNDQPFKP